MAYRSCGDFGRYVHFREQPFDPPWAEVNRIRRNESTREGTFAMSELTNEDVAALAKAVNLEIAESDLTQVAYSLGAILEAVESIELSGLNAVEPLPVIEPTQDRR